ncbi:MAG: hypothetical protein AMXMBFR55_30510 [Gemmatimonadota bacterium]
MSPLPPFDPIFRGVPAGVLFGGAFLLLVAFACVSDVRARRIPNALVAVLATAGIAFSVVRLAPLAGLGSALSGMALGLAIWIAFYALGLLGAGDVKFFAAAAAWLGPAGAWRASLIAAAIGGVLAVGFLLRDSKLKAALHRIVLLPVARSFAVTTLQEMSNDEARRQLPYGVALGAGAVVVAMFPAVLT